MPRRRTRRQSTIVHHSWEKKFHDFGCDGARLHFRALSRRIAPGEVRHFFPEPGQTPSLRSTRGNVIYNPGPDTFTVPSTSDGMVSLMENRWSEELGAGLQMGAALRNALDEQTQ